MNYNELIQLYFERSTAMQAYWNLYVVIVGGLLAFSSLRKQPAAITTLIVSILFALFAYENLDAMYDTTRQRFATIQAIKQFDLSETNAANWKQTRDMLFEPASGCLKRLTKGAEVPTVLLGPDRPHVPDLL